MKRSIVFHESQIRADNWPLWLLVVLGAIALALALATAVAAATAYYSFTGKFTNGTETQSFLFNIDRGLPRTAPFSLRTWHYNGTPIGQGNAAGDPIDPGGFDPQLWLYDATPALVVSNDDGPTGLDSLINWSTSGMPESLAGGDYQLDLVAFGSELGGRDGHWAVDLEADAAKFTLTGVDEIDGTGGTSIRSLAMGSDDARVPAKLQLGVSDSVSMTGRLAVGNTGNAAVTVTTGSLTSGNGVLGDHPGSVGSVALSLGGSWEATNIGAISIIGESGEGNLQVDSGSLALFNYDLAVGYALGSMGNVTVKDFNSFLTVNSGLSIGLGGVGHLRVENHGRVKSIGVIGTGDTIGWFTGSNGLVEVDGQDSMWQTAQLIVGNQGQGTVNITNGGKIDTTGNAYIGKTADGAASSVTIAGMSPALTKATWLVSGNLYIAGDEFGPSSAAFSKLTINPGALVDVADATIVWDPGGSLELLGGEMETGSLIVKPGATFTHHDGTLTVNGFTFDPGVANYKIDGADAADLPVVKLINGAAASIPTDYPLTVGEDYRGRLEILSGSQVDLPDAYNSLFIGDNTVCEGEVIVDGQGSSLTTNWYVTVGYNGRGVLRIRNGGLVDSFYPSIAYASGSVGIMEVFGTDPIGTPSTYTTHDLLIVGNEGHGTLTISAGGRVNALAGAAIAWRSSANGSSATVTGLNSRWAITGPLYVGGTSAGADGIGTLSVANSDQVTAGNITVWQPGTVELGNNGTISTGNFELAGGKLQGSGIVNVSGQLTNAGVVAPGLSAGFITVNGNYVQNLAGELAIEIGGTGYSDFDRLNIENGSASLHGKLAVSLIDTGGGIDVFQPNAGDRFEILIAADGLGGTTFATEVLPALRGGLYFGVLYNPNDVTLVAAGVLGDYNRNGTVDAADYVVWWKTFSGPNVPASNLAADGDGDSDVDQGDFIVWRSHFGQIAGSGSLLGSANASDAIPEPTTLWLAMLGIYTLVHRLARPSSQDGRLKVAGLVAFVLLCFLHSRTAYADTFGSGANTFTIDFVNIGNAGNSDDRALDDINNTPDDPNDDENASPYGGMKYAYRMGVMEVPQDWITKATNLGMTNVTAGAWIGNEPAANISSFEAAAFVNWLNNQRTPGLKAYDLTWTGSAWTMNLWSIGVAWDNDPGAGVDVNRYRHKDAYYFLPSEDEWYKAAYHKNDGVTGDYWDYATGENREPTEAAGGTEAGTAVWNLAAGSPVEVDNNGGLSPYGTRGQTGNVFEWQESDFIAPNDSPSKLRAFRGGCWFSSYVAIASSVRDFTIPQDELFNVGFRVASVPDASPVLLGDYNMNGVVDAADYVVWRKNVNTSNALPNDPIGGTIGPAQYDQWRAHFGQSAGSGALAAVRGPQSNLDRAIPEPASLALLVIGGALLASLMRGAGSRVTQRSET